MKELGGRAEPFKTLDSSLAERRGRMMRGKGKGEEQGHLAEIKGALIKGSSRL